MISGEFRLDLRPWPPVLLTRSGDDGRAILCGGGRIRVGQWRRPEREVLVGTLDPADGFADAEILEVAGIEGRKPVGELFGVEVAQAKADARRGIRDDGARDVPVLRPELLQLLVGEDEPECVLPGAREEERERGVTK
jgi:hypothetical protein